MTATAPTAQEIASLARDLDRLARYAPSAAAFVRRDLNAMYAARTLTYRAGRDLIDTTRHEVRYSDEYLTNEATEMLGSRPTGTARAASYLLTVPQHAREAVVTDATLCTNMSGGRYADNVQASAARWQSALAARDNGTHHRLAHGTYSEPNLPGTGG